MAHLSGIRGRQWLTDAQSRGRFLVPTILVNQIPELTVASAGIGSHLVHLHRFHCVSGHVRPG